MPRRSHRKKARRRERRTRPRVLRAEWWYRGRPVVIVEVPPRGRPWAEVTVPYWRVDYPGRMAAAFWAMEFFPRLSHEEVYVMLWE